jgi:hypothetical protein
MTHKVLRLVFVLEFLMAIVALFTAWSEIGGQATLDLMHWGWKLGLSVAFAGAVVGYSTTLISTDSLWTLRSMRWLMAIVVLCLAIGVVTYYYALQVDTGQSDETGTTSMTFSRPAMGFSAYECC